VKVAPDLSLPGHPEVFVVGDLASVGAGRQARARRRAGCEADGRRRGARDRLLASPAARPHRFATRTSATSPRSGASRRSVDLHGLRLSGLLAWWFWLVAHLFFLIGFRNRVAVLVNWAWSYWTYQRHARIITGPH
jgi:NADH dehydrogenase